MTDPAQVLAQVHADAADLDAISKALYAATEEYIEAEEAWEILQDATAEALIEEYRDAGRKSDPAEHTIIGATRRQHRSQWTRLRRAKRTLEYQEKRLQARRAALNGRQSELACLRDEAKLSEGPQPQWTQGVRSVGG